jgi:hypothetical protein
MTGRRFDALAARLLERTRDDDVEPPGRDARARAVLALEGAIRRKARRRLLARSLLAAAAVLVVGVSAVRVHREQRTAATARSIVQPSAVTVVGHPRGGGATIVETGAPSPLTDGAFLSPGSRILAQSDGHVVLAVSTGTRLTVEGKSDVSIVDAGPNETFLVSSGAVRADVAKLHPGQRFVIRTPDAEVEVRGTSFRVATATADPACGDGTVTRVEVYEGVVSVRHAGDEARVPAGQSWPSGCPATPGAPPAERAMRPHVTAQASRKAPPEPAPSDTASAIAVRAETEEPASDLREQNDAFARALAAKRRGATAEAVNAFDAFIARYPASSLVENALVQRMRILETDPGRGAGAARLYLSRFPNGFARDEAAAIAHRAP